MYVCISIYFLLKNDRKTQNGDLITVGSCAGYLTVTCCNSDLQISGSGAKSNTYFFRRGSCDWARDG